MPETEKARLIHGLSNFHSAVVKKDDPTGVEYGTIRKIEGAVSVSGTANTESNPKYADNGIFAILNNFDSLDVSMAAIDIPKLLKNEMYGQKVVNGVEFSNKDDEIKEIALGFEAKLRGGGTRFYWLLKGTPEILGIEHETDQGSIESKDAELSIKFAPLRSNGNWKMQLDSELVKSDDWFADVVYDEVTAKALPGEEQEETP